MAPTVCVCVCAATVHSRIFHVFAHTRFFRASRTHDKRAEGVDSRQSSPAATVKRCYACNLLAVADTLASRVVLKANVKEQPSCTYQEIAAVVCVCFYVTSAGFSSVETDLTNRISFPKQALLAA